MNRSYLSREYRQPGIVAQQMLLSTINYSAMPFVRLAIGDSATISYSPCSCGLPGAQLTHLHGRNIPCFFFGDGTMLDPLRVNRILFDIPSVCDYQLVQMDVRLIRLFVRLERTAAYADVIARAAASLSKCVSSEISIDVQVVGDLPSGDRFVTLGSAGSTL